MERQGSESAEDNLLKPVECNNIHSSMDNVEAGLAKPGGHLDQTVVSSGMELPEDDDSAESDSDSSDDEHHEFPPDS
ncbi:hypothetical protein ElyMa_006804100 [Elysia marginata]|uniref:CTNNB1 binding N-teminal domain-containing protein n=1 Tax=Elysia marginata TaxID=1093978 RepID=A0AAV4J325_9GAST|nr:hypothetical protein ElyMa_006804100 [Elysia marginata]